VSGSEKDLQNSLITLTKILQEYQTKINVNETETMAVTLKQKKSVKLEIDNNSIEQVKQFKYLGSTLISDGRCSIEIKQQITMAKREFIR